MTFFREAFASDFGRPVVGRWQRFSFVLVSCNGPVRWLLSGLVSGVVLVDGVPLLVVEVVVEPSEPLLQLGHFGGGRRLPGLRRRRRHLETVGLAEGVDITRRCWTRGERKKRWMVQA